MISIIVTINQEENKGISLLNIQYSENKTYSWHNYREKNIKVLVKNKHKLPKEGERSFELARLKSASCESHGSVVQKQKSRTMCATLKLAFSM